MARVLGAIPANAAEQAVLRALKTQLPDDWWIVSDASWSTRTSAEGLGGQKYVRDGQADFVVFAPGFGMMIVEVKGSHHVRIQDDGRWYRREQDVWLLVSPTPVVQATRNAHEIARILAGYLREEHFGIRFGWMVVYPNGKLTEGSFYTLDATSMVFKSQMSDLVGRIRLALEARGPAAKGASLTPTLARELAEVVATCGVAIGPADTDADVGADVAGIERLAQQQFAALQGVFRHRRVAVTGPAGSGKTVLAIWRLAALVEEGVNALYLCFNKQLAEYLRWKNPVLASYIKHVDSYFAAVAPGTAPVGGRDRFFREELPGHVIDVVSTWSEDKKYGAIIVDEGQDFGEFRLMAVCELLAKNGYYVYCSDGRQDLYHAGALTSVGAEVGFLLVHNCRNTVKINDTANRVAQDKIPSMPGLPDGEPPVVRRCADRAAMAKACWEVASGWVGVGSKVAVLSPYQLEGSCVSGKRTGFGKRLVTTLHEWEAADAVLFSTIKSFKGMEADAVIVIDIDANSPSIEPSEFYVACTRGRARLAVLHLGERHAVFP
jgi:hypothetical protein